MSDPKKPSTLKAFGAAVMELLGQLLYRGPR
jgi:hypothetical protein